MDTDTYKIIEHTADVGIRAQASTLAGLFVQMTLGLCDIAGTWRPGPGDPHPLTIPPGDLEALLVDWLNEVLWVQDSLDRVITEVSLQEISVECIKGSVSTAVRKEALQGTAVKAVTYHGLEVKQRGSAWQGRVYVDV
jgi:SHS2 domain-containing protein